MLSERIEDLLINIGSDVNPRDVTSAIKPIEQIVLTYAAVQTRGQIAETN